MTDRMEEARQLLRDKGLLNPKPSPILAEMKKALDDIKAGRDNAHYHAKLIATLARLQLNKE